MGFPRQEYWSGLLFSPPRNLPDLGIEPTSPVSPALQANSLPTEPSGSSEVLINLKKENFSNGEEWHIHKGTLIQRISHFSSDVIEPEDMETISLKC